MRLASIGLRIALGILVVVACLVAMQATAQAGAAGGIGTDENIPEVTDAKGRFINGDFDGALEFLRKAFEKNPDRLPPAQVVMALWFSEVNQGQASLTSLEKAILENPNDPQAYLIIANSEIQSGRVTAASMLFDKANSLLASLDSSARKKTLEPAILAGLAAVAEYRATMSTDDAARAQKEWLTAQKHLEAWLAIVPDNTAAMQRLSRALFKQTTKETVDRAYAVLQEAKKADENVLTPSATMALYYQDAGDFEQAQRFMNHALSEAPDDVPTLLVATQWCLQTSLEDSGQLDKAEEYAVKAVTLEETLDTLILRGAVALYQKRYEIADRIFQSAYLKSPGSFAASNNLALALCEQEESKKRRALEYAQNNVKQYPNSPEAASTYGWVLYKTGRIAEADQVFNRLVTTTRVGADTYYYAAQVAADATPKRPEQAKQLVERALSGNRPFSMRPEALLLREELNKQ